MLPLTDIPDRATMTRALRDLEAARARVERDAEAVFEATRKKLVAELLPVLDNLDRTIRAATEHDEAPVILDGATLVRAQLAGVLRGYGVEQFAAIGERFDPRVHDAVGMAPVRDPARASTVLEVIEPGYRVGDSLLRPAKVVVGRAIT